MTWKRLCAALLLALMSNYADAQLSTSYRDGVLVCTIRGDGTNDNTWMASAVTACNAWSGPSLIRPVGRVKLTGQHDLTGATSIIGATPSSGFDVDITGTSQFITYNLSYAPETEATFELADVAAGDAVLTVTSGTAPVKGDLIVIWSHDNITGLTAHWDSAANGYGHGQHPESIHLVDEAFANKVIINDPAPFSMTAAGRARGSIVPAATLDRGIVIDNLLLDWVGAGDAPNYATMFRFVAIDGVTVTDRVVTTRKAPGAFWFDYCTNITCNPRINGSANNDGIYGLVVGPVNGMICDPVVKGTRHGFTTTAGQNSSTASIAVDSIDDPGDRIVIAGHGLLDGYHFTVVNTVSNLSNNTAYWIVNSTVNDFQVATSPGGAPLTLTGTTATGTLRRYERWGTPLNIVCRGIWYSAPKWSDSTTTITRQVWDTHAEGYGIVVNGAHFVSHSDQEGVSSRITQFLAQSRSIGTVFTNCTFEGSGHASNKAIRLLARDCKVLNNSFNGRFWYGVECIKVNGTASPLTTDSPDNCVIAGNHFKGVTGYTVRLAGGDNHVITRNVFTDCSDAQGASPFYSKSLIGVLRGTGHRVLGNQMPKDVNDTVLDMYQLATSDITVTGNNMTGYGSGVAGFGRVLAVSAWDETNDEVDVTTSHGFSSNDQIQFVGTPLPTGVVAGTVYYVITADTDSFQFSASSGPGTPVTWTGATGTGASVQNGTVDEFETAYDGLNTIDE